MDGRCEMRIALALRLLLVVSALSPSLAEAQSATPPEQIRLAAGGYPDERKLGADLFACVRQVGVESVASMEALFAKNPTTNPEAVAKLRTLANWMECMNNRGYIVPMKWLSE
jgi:hypothetical protein